VYKRQRLEWLVPIVTAALVALINWIPKIVATAAAATFTYTIAGVTNAVDIDTVCYNPDYDLWVWSLP
jgi:hypothetical protein